MEEQRHVKVGEVLDESTDERERREGPPEGRLFAAVGEPLRAQDLADRSPILFQTNATILQTVEIAQYNTPNLQGLNLNPPEQLREVGFAAEFANATAGDETERKGEKGKGEPEKKKEKKRKERERREKDKCKLQEKSRRLQKQLQIQRWQAKMQSNTRDEA